MNETFSPNTDKNSTPEFDYAAFIDDLSRRRQEIEGFLSEHEKAINERLAVLSNNERQKMIEMMAERIQTLPSVIRMRELGIEAMADNPHQRAPGVLVNLEGVRPILPTAIYDYIDFIIRLMPPKLHIGGLYIPIYNIIIAAIPNLQDRLRNFIQTGDLLDIYHHETIHAQQRKAGFLPFIRRAMTEPMLTEAQAYRQANPDYAAHHIDRGVLRDPENTTSREYQKLMTALQLVDQALFLGIPVAKIAAAITLSGDWDDSRQTYPGVAKLVLETAKEKDVSDEELNQVANYAEIPKLSEIVQRLEIRKELAETLLNKLPTA